MKKPLSLLLLIVYAAAFAWASFKPWDGFRLLLIAGSLVSLPIILEGLLKIAKSLLIIAVLTTASICIPILAPFCAIYMIYAAYKQLTSIISHLFLIITGGGMYLLLYIVPVRLADLFQLSPLLQGILLFVLGALAIISVCRMLIKLGYPGDKVAAFVIGLPGFLLLLLFTLSGDMGDLMDDGGHH